MSSTQQGSSGCECSTKKNERNRRCWTQMEEATLLVAIKDLIANGWKSDNGFRAGYLNRLEIAMKLTFPNTDLKALPHINSKLCSWKKYYCSIMNMLAKSGVGFSESGNHMIQCEDHLWDEICKCDNNARTMRYKAWPYYDDWKEIFGKDRATGEGAEDVAEAAKELHKDGLQGLNRNAQAEDDYSFENEINTDAYDGMSQSARDDQAPANSAKKPKLTGELEGVCQLLSDMNHETNSRLEHLANRIGYEFDMGKARQETFDQLGEIPGLSQEDRFIVCELIAFKAERLDIWRGMKPDARAQYVEHLLKQNGRA